jgi:hypothetical protein
LRLEMARPPLLIGSWGHISTAVVEADDIPFPEVEEMGELVHRGVRISDAERQSGS